MKVKLSVLKNNEIVQDFEIPEVSPEQIESGISYYIGRSSECHVCIEDQLISRQHARIEFKDNVWTIHKLSDLGNILVNGSPVNTSEINTGDIINLGPYLINFFATAPIADVQVDPEPQPEAVAEDVNFEDEKTVFLGDEHTQELDRPEEEASSPDETSEVDIGEETNDFDASEAAVHDNLLGDEEEAEEHFSAEENEQGYDSQETEFQENNDGFNEGFEEGFNDGFDDDMGGGLVDGDKTNFAQTFAQFYLEIKGEFTRLDNYIIADEEVFIGRDPEKCQIVLDDPEVSSVHASIKKHNIACILHDKQSSNGTILNGKRINQSALTNGDEFLIGTTNFIFKIKSELLNKESERLMPVEDNQEVEIEEYVEEEVDEEEFMDEPLALGDGMGESAEAASGGKFSLANLKNDPEARKKILYAVVFAVAAWVVLDEGEKPAPPAAANKTTGKNYKLDKAKKLPSVVKKSKVDLKLTAQEQDFVETTYQLAKELYEAGEFFQAEQEVDKILNTTKGQDYKNARQIKQLAREGYAQLEEIEKKKREERDRKERAAKVSKLVEKAQEATDKKQVEVAEALFQQIMGLDPENPDVPTMRLTIDAWKREQEKKQLEAEAKKIRRNRMIKALKPGEALYLKERWYQAIIKLEEFLRISDLDEDVIIKASNMLKESKKNLSNQIAPIMGKAKSLQEGQDLKGAYEAYKEVIEIDPSNLESMNEMSIIKDTLESKSRVVYREAIISESLNLLNEAKEKFQEVQQMSPTDSEYYRKATEKLESYGY